MMTIQKQASNRSHPSLPKTFLIYSYTSRLFFPFSLSTLIDYDCNRTSFLFLSRALACLLQSRRPSLPSPIGFLISHLDLPLKTPKSAPPFRPIALFFWLWINLLFEILLNEIVGWKFCHWMRSSLCDWFRWWIQNFTSKDLIYFNVGLFGRKYD